MNFISKEEARKLYLEAENIYQHVNTTLWFDIPLRPNMYVCVSTNVKCEIGRTGTGLEEKMELFRREHNLFIIRGRGNDLMKPYPIKDNT